MVINDFPHETRQRSKKATLTSCRVRLMLARGDVLLLGDFLVYKSVTFWALTL